MPTTLKFDGPSAYLIPEPATEPELVVLRGATFETDRPEEHLTSPDYDCSRVGDVSPVKALAKAHDRDGLNDLAREAGVENPEGLSNKTEVAEAIVAAQHEPEAEGVGPDNSNEEEG